MYTTRLVSSISIKAGNDAVRAYECTCVGGHSVVQSKHKDKLMGGGPNTSWDQLTSTDEIEYQF